MKDEKSSIDQMKGTKTSKGYIESLENSVASSARTVKSKKTIRHMERNDSKGKEKEKTVNLIGLNEKLIEERMKRVGRFPANSPMDKAKETVRGISR